MKVRAFTLLSPYWGDSTFEISSALAALEPVSRKMLEWNVAKRASVK